MKIFASLGLALFCVASFADPSWKMENIDLGIQNEGSAYSKNLFQYIDNPQNTPVQFVGLNMPRWMKIPDAAAGIVSGTPERIDEGKYENVVFVMKWQGGEARTSAFGEVKRVPHYPRWVAETYKLPKAVEDKTYYANLAHNEILVNDDQFPLKFKMISSPAWVKVTEAGLLFATPKAEHLKDCPVRATVAFTTSINGVEYSRSALFTFEITHVNHPPRWLANPLVLEKGSTGIPYSQPLANSAEDIDEGDTLTFERVSGPQWATITPQGTFHGTPVAPSTELQEWEVKVSDGQEFALTKVRIRVEKSNEPPRWREPLNLPNADEDFDYTVPLSPLAFDPDYDRLWFAKEAGSPWLKVSPEGILSGRPAAEDVGIAKITLRVSDQKTGSATTEAFFEVKHTNHKPVWVLDPIQITVREDEKLKRDLKLWVKDKDTNDTLTLSIASGNPWLQLSPDGQLEGTPHGDEIGTHSYKVMADDGRGGQATVTMVVTVIHMNHAPKWAAQTTDLGHFQEDSDVQVDLRPYAVDTDKVDQGKLLFTKVSGASWAIITGNGQLIGVPRRQHAGQDSVRVRVKDPSGESAEASFAVFVDKVNKPPVWLSNPLSLGEMLEGAFYQRDLRDTVKDPDDDTITFTKLSGPAWLTLSPAGILSGTPQETDAGDFTLTVQAKDAQFAPLGTLTGHVKLTNKAPQVVGNLEFALKENTDFVVDLAEPNYILDKNNDALTFSFVHCENWVQLSPNGKLTAQPVHDNVGTHKFTLVVNDGSLETTAPVTLVVARNARPPIWLEDPVQVTAELNVPLSTNIARYGHDKDNWPLTFDKVSGDGWLTVAPNGDLSGTPPSTGLHIFTVAAKNDVYSTEGKLRITVVAQNAPPRWDQAEFTLTQAVGGVVYEQNLSKFAHDINEDRLHFSKVSGPDWGLVTDTGVLIGQPPVDASRTASFVVKVTDPKQAFAQATFIVPIKGNNNRAPKWRLNTLQLGNIRIGEEYQFDLSAFAYDEDGDPLTYLWKSQTTWLSVSHNGLLRGTPTGVSQGDFHFDVEVSDGKLSTPITITGRVIGRNATAAAWDLNSLKLDPSATVVWAVDPSSEQSFKLAKTHSQANPKQTVVFGDGEISFYTWDSAKNYSFGKTNRTWKTLQSLAQSFGSNPVELIVVSQSADLSMAEEEHLDQWIADHKDASIRFHWILLGCDKREELIPLVDATQGIAVKPQCNE